MSLFKVDDIQYILDHPYPQEISLQAWNAADELVAQQFKPYDLNSNDKILIINDSFGALTCIYHKQCIMSVSDSETSFSQIKHNLSRNNLNYAHIQFKSMLDDWVDADYIFIVVPKSLDLLEMILSKLTTLKSKHIVLSVMIKHMPNKFYETIKEYFENIESSKIIKKARLTMISHPKSQKKYQPTRTINFNGISLLNYKSIFSSSQIDFGSELLYNELTQGIIGKKVLDIGTGNGFLCISLSQLYPNSTFVGYDDSHLAIESAKLNSKENPNCEFFTSKNGDFLNEQTFDMIVCNPPFHLGHVVTERIADEMFHIGKKYLSKNGTFWIVFNRSLNYKMKLSRLFKNVNLVAENRKFRVIKCSE